MPISFGTYNQTAKGFTRHLVSRIRCSIFKIPRGKPSRESPISRICITFLSNGKTSHGQSRKTRLGVFGGVLSKANCISITRSFWGTIKIKMATSLSTKSRLKSSDGYIRNSLTVKGPVGLLETWNRAAY